MKKKLLIIFVSLLLSGNASATLKGVNKVALLIEDISKYTVECSVTRKKIETTAKYILQNSKIKTDPEFITIIYIRVIGVHNGDICSIYSRITVETNLAKDPYQLGNRGSFIFYQNERIAVGGINNNIGDLVINSIEEMMKELVVQHHEDNQ
tara:strand:- start:1010 stop:1465 length:456 start_codon:yes stop_codon:yes gene_type:complete